MKRTDFLPTLALSVMLLTGLGLTVVAPVWSADDGHGFRVLSAQSYPQDNLYLFDADVALRFSDEVLDALGFDPLDMRICRTGMVLAEDS